MKSIGVYCMGKINYKGALSAFVRIKKQLSGGMS